VIVYVEWLLNEVLKTEIDGQITRYGTDKKKISLQQKESSINFLGVYAYIGFLLILFFPYPFLSYCNPLPLKIHNFSLIHLLLHFLLFPLLSSPPQTTARTSLA
jgi:hypothetical protein